MFDDEQAGRLAVQQDFAQAQAENAELFSQNEQLSSTLGKNLLHVTGTKRP